MSYFCKMFLSGNQADEAAKWIFTGNVNKGINKFEWSRRRNLIKVTN